MIRLLILLLLCSPVFAGQVINSYIKYPPAAGGAISVVVEATMTGVINTSTTSSSFTPPADSLLLLSCAVGNPSINLLQPSDSSGYTWTRQHHVAATADKANVSFHTATASSSPASMTVTVESTNSTPDRGTCAVYSIENYDTVTTFGGTASFWQDQQVTAIDETNYTVALSASSTADDAVFAGINCRPPNGTDPNVIGTGWTLDSSYDLGSAPFHDSDIFHYIGAKDNVEMDVIDCTVNYSTAIGGLVVNGE